MVLLFDIFFQTLREELLPKEEELQSRVKVWRPISTDSGGVEQWTLGVRNLMYP